MTSTTSKTQRLMIWLATGLLALGLAGGQLVGSAEAGITTSSSGTTGGG